MDVMKKILNELKTYLDNASQEELKQSWKEVEKFENIGPTVNQFVIDTLFAKLHEITAERDYYRNRIEELEKGNNND